jgi:DNA-binding transcriptional ArsR family regulator/uncharacterized protein YndB with AHSA1/START domain
VTDLQQVLDAIGSPVRRRMLRLVWDQELPATRIAEACGVTPPTASAHLATLVAAGLVVRDARGTYRYYRADREALDGLHALLDRDAARWRTADDLPETDRAGARAARSVVAGVDVATDRATTFGAFVDPTVFSRWLGVPVRLEDGRFSCTLEWGTTVAGDYEVVHPPSLLALRWNFDDDSVPLPGRDLPAYVRFEASGAGDGCRVEVHQLVDTEVQAEFMATAWAMVLGRLADGVVAATDPTTPVAARRPRPKRRAGPGR